jgi:hypothetical protein
MGLNCFYQEELQIDSARLSSLLIQNIAKLNPEIEAD